MSAPETPLPIRVLLVDDDPRILDAHRAYVERIPGFTVVADTTSARVARDYILASNGCTPHRLRPATTEPVDLILLDISMRDGSGLDVLKHIRAHGIHTAVCVVSGLRDADSVRQASALGATQYLVKPFTFATFSERMQQFAALHQLTLSPHAATQQDIDALFSAARATPRPTLPKGLSAETLHTVTHALQREGACTAREIAATLGLSRVGARRYLEHLHSTGRAARHSRYGATGRPQMEYRWQPRAG